MRIAATAVLVALVAAFVCSADASLTPTNPCCQPCDMADGSAPSCDCCRLATLEFPSLMAAKGSDLTVSPALVILPFTLPLPANEAVGAYFFEPGELVRAHSPPKLYILNTSLLI